MSDKDLARRTIIKVFFDGVDITSDITPYINSLTFTDSEDEETDDLQIKLHDSDSLWLEKWLNDAIEAAAETPSSVGGNGNSYSVTATGGVNVRSGPGTNYSKLGTLAYGTIVNVESISGKWAKTTYSGKTAYIHTDYLQKTTVTGASSNDWQIGDEVVCSGRPQYTSYGEGSPGANVTNYKGKITYLNLKDGVKYPICVGYLGWFAESQVSKLSENANNTKTEGAASKGLSIQACIVRQNWNNDGKDSVLECGQFELDSVVASGPPATVTIKGTSLPYDSSVRQTKKSKSWENYTLKGIAGEIAKKNGMTVLFSSSTNPSYKRVEQYRMSDIAFLQKLCNDAGCSLKVSNNIIIVFEQESYEKKDVILTLTRGQGGYSKYNLKTGKDNTYTSCRVSYVDSSGKCISGTAYVDDYKEDNEKNQCLEISQKVSSVAEAKSLAAKHLKLHNKYELTATFTVSGNPKLLAGCTVELKGWGAWSGKYIIKQAKHSVSKSGYNTDLTLRKIIQRRIYG